MTSAALVFFYIKVEPYEMPGWGFKRRILTVGGENLAFAAWVTWITFHVTRSAINHIPWERWEPWVDTSFSKDDFVISSAIFIGYVVGGISFYFLVDNYIKVMLFKRAVVTLVLAMGIVYYYYLALLSPFKQNSKMLSKDWGPVPPCPHMWEDPVWRPAL